MQLPRSFFLLVIGAVWPALACSCGSYEPTKACELYQRTPVIFRGRVVDHNDDRTAGFGQVTLYRFQVLEAFKGLPRGAREVFINPGSLTSCYTQFDLDRDYLVYTGGAEPAPAAVTILGGGRRGSKPIPAAWNGLEQLPVYLVGGCSPTRTVKDGDPDLAYLRSAAIGRVESGGWIEGRAVQNFSWPYRFADFVSAPDAIFTLISASGQHRTAPVQKDGALRIGSVQPGVYTVSVQSATLGGGKLLEPKLEVQRVVAP